MPTLIQLATFLESLYNLWSLTRGNLVSREVIEERFAICKTCEHFDTKGCDLCGCCIGKHQSLFNKIAYPTEQCPANPPKWPKII